MVETTQLVGLSRELLQECGLSSLQQKYSGTADPAPALVHLSKVYFSRMWSLSTVEACPPMLRLLRRTYIKLPTALRNILLLLPWTMAVQNVSKCAANVAT